MLTTDLKEQPLEPSDVDVGGQLHGAEADPVIVGRHNAALPRHGARRFHGHSCPETGELLGLVEAHGAVSRAAMAAGSVLGKRP